MLISTTSTIEGKQIKSYRGVVFGEVINGVNFIRDFTAGISNVLGGRATEYEEELVSNTVSFVYVAPKNTLHYYNENNEWQCCYVYYYNGTNWEPCIAYYYDGEWKQC